MKIATLILLLVALTACTGGSTSPRFTPLTIATPTPTPTPTPQPTLCPKAAR